MEIFKEFTFSIGEYEFGRALCNALLPVIEEGGLTNPYGHTVGFKNTMIAMTSNLGLQKIFEKAPAKATA